MLRNSSRVSLVYIIRISTLMVKNQGGRNLNTSLLLSVAEEISKPPFLGAPEVQRASTFAVFVRFTSPLNVSNHAHIWYVT